MASMQLVHPSHQSDNISQEQKIHELRTHLGPISGPNLKYCTDSCLRRYLEAQGWDVRKSTKMLEDTLRWRSTYRPEQIRWHEVAMEGETGKAYRASFRDHEGRTVLILRPGKQMVLYEVQLPPMGIGESEGSSWKTHKVLGQKTDQNTSSHDNQLRHLVYLMENAVLNIPEGQDQIVWLIDFTGWSLSKTVPMKTAKETISILQNHYPERLYAAFLYNPPRIFEAFWKIVKHFLDTKTIQKVKFVYPKNEESMKLMLRSFDLEVLPQEFGGRRKVQYNHEEFSWLMVMDDARAANMWGTDA